jgi:phosphopantothenoylcysteine decarboxylase/phosphopantothenate--cysteine ligase
LITTPVNISPPAGCELVQVRTAQEMRDAVLSAASEVTALIMAAAVADFTPRQPSANKIKKRTGPPEIDLTFTPDILTEVAQAKKGSGYPLRVIGFAAESGDLLKNAGEKLASKNLDMIVANDISAKDAGFEVDTNRVVFIYADGSQRAFPNMPKAEVAAEVLAQVAAWFTDDSEVTE